MAKVTCVRNSWRCSLPFVWSSTKTLAGHLRSPTSPATHRSSPTLQRARQSHKGKARHSGDGCTERGVREKNAPFRERDQRYQYGQHSSWLCRAGHSRSPTSLATPRSSPKLQRARHSNKERASHFHKGCGRRRMRRTLRATPRGCRRSAARYLRFRAEREHVHRF